MTTIAEIAKLVGHSPSTVSRALNNSGYVNQDTRQRIMKVIERLDYIPNIHAERLRNGASKTIALIVKELTNPFWAEVARGAEEVVWQKGYDLIVRNTNGDPEREFSILRSFRRKSVDGVLVDWLRGGWAELKALEEQDIATIAFSSTAEEYGFDVFVIDNIRGGYVATKHLLELGHRRVAFVTAEYTKDRELGYRKAMKEYYLTPCESLIFQQKTGDESDIDRAMARWFRDKSERPTAIFAYNDITAIRIWMELERRNLMVPEDVSLVGFDNIPIAGLIRNGLTTVALPHFEYGRSAAEFLLQRICEGRGRTGKSVVLSPELIIRGSTRPWGVN